MSLPRVVGSLSLWWKFYVKYNALFVHFDTYLYLCNQGFLQNIAHCLHHGRDEGRDEVRDESRDEGMDEGRDEGRDHWSLVKLPCLICVNLQRKTSKQTYSNLSHQISLGHKPTAYSIHSTCSLSLYTTAPKSTPVLTFPLSIIVFCYKHLTKYVHKIDILYWVQCFSVSIILLKYLHVPCFSYLSLFKKLWISIQLHNYITHSLLYWWKFGLSLVLGHLNQVSKNTLVEFFASIYFPFSW